MAKPRVIAINIDAFDIAYSNALIAQGKLKGLAKLRDRSARFNLLHGNHDVDRNTGRTGEHIATGRKPESTGMWAPFLFRKEDYSIVQTFTREMPFPAALGAKTVVFDPSYFDLEACPDVRGLVGWSGHDPGANESCNPAGLKDEIIARFGDAAIDDEDLNHSVYGSAEKTRWFANAVNDTLKKRFDVASWLLGERFTDWDFAMISIEESHDAIEHMAHGFIKDHPLSKLPCAKDADEGLQLVYETISDGLERLMDEFPDAIFAVYTMHGMGPNKTDVPSMVLLPELMFRAAFGKPFFRSREDWMNTDTPMIRSDEEWFPATVEAMRAPFVERVKHLPVKIGQKVDALLGRPYKEPSGEPRNDRERSLNWSPAPVYRRFWPRMKAFALPSLFDGCIRVNLEGRERDGFVKREDYQKVLDEVETLLRECVNPVTGNPVVDTIRYFDGVDPYEFNETQADLRVYWSEPAYAFEHPKLGLIGPAPVRRAGGHTGGFGALYLSGNGFEAGDYGEFNSFDVPATLVDLLGEPKLNSMDGTSVLPVLRRSA